MDVLDRPKYDQIAMTFWHGPNVLQTIWIRLNLLQDSGIAFGHHFYFKIFPRDSKKQLRWKGLNQLYIASLVEISNNDAATELKRERERDEKVQEHK